jgi:hypothetical protein
MNVTENFHDFEKKTGIRFSEKFHEFIMDFEKITHYSEFSSLFKNFHFCATEEIIRAKSEFIPEEFAPFFVEKNGKFDDYYCFETNNKENKNRVIVFSQNSVVFEWEDYASFLSWLSQKMGKK